eukprot:sb/3479025/
MELCGSTLLSRGGVAVGPCPDDKSIPVSGESGVTFGVVLSVVLAAPVLVPVLHVFPVGGIDLSKSKITYSSFEINIMGPGHYGTRYLMTWSHNTRN